MTNTQLFQQVVKSNVEQLTNSINEMAFKYATLKIASRTMTEDEIRNEAVRFFYAEVALKVGTQLINNI